MNKLRKQILKYFLLCAFIISVAESVADSTFEQLLFPRFEVHLSVLLGIYVVISIGLFIIGAYVFYRLTKKAIEAESKRQVKEQSMIYACIAHDLKTPMTSVQGFATALRDGKIKPEEQREILDIIYRKGLYMNELTDALFAYAKLGTYEYVLTMGKVNLCKLVRDLVAECYSDFEDNHIELNIEIPDKPIFIQADEKELRRGINNLIVNAYKHNCKGTQVLIKVHAKSGKAIVTIADNGEAIVKELQSALFEPFVSSNTSRTTGNGSGLGLAISSKIIDLHGGSLYLDNSINKYTKEFVISLCKSGN